MLLSKPEITKMFRKAAQVWNENKDYLSEIDSRFGDGDHGVTIGKIAGLIEKSLDGWDDDDVETFLEDLGDNTMEIGGGSAGPLYGTMIGGLSGPLEGNKPIDAGTLKEMFTEANGYSASFAYSKENEKQINAAQKFVQDEVDYLLLSAADTAGWDSVLKDAQAAGVKVILFDRVIDADPSLYEASIVSDMEKEGQTAVDWLAKQNLEEYNIIHLQGQMGTAAQKGRTAAMDAAVASNDNWNLVVQQSGDWNAENATQIVQSIINSGESFNVIYAENDDMAKGAVAALDKANISHGVGKDVIIMGFDCNKWALEELLNQNWNYDGQCNPFQASYIDDIIKKLENGETITEKQIIMEEKGFDATEITADDVAKYGI